jgi:hypothetical protein
MSPPAAPNPDSPLLPLSLSLFFNCEVRPMPYAVYPKPEQKVPEVVFHKKAILWQNKYLSIWQ